MSKDSSRKEIHQSSTTNKGQLLHLHFAASTIYLAQKDKFWVL